MKIKKNIFSIHFINILLFAALFLVQYSSTFNLKIFTVHPILPLALLVAICMYCSELRGAVTGLVVGIFLDTTTSTPQGFNAIVYCFLGLASVLVIKHLFNNNILSAVSLCALCSLFYFITRWVFTIAFSLSFTENLKYIMSSIFPSCLYTAVFIIPLYYVEKFIYKKLYK